jgi:hypothetical protein
VDTPDKARGFPISSSGLFFFGNAIALFQNQIDLQGIAAPLFLTTPRQGQRRGPLLRRLARRCCGVSAVVPALGYSPPLIPATVRGGNTEGCFSTPPLALGSHQRYTQCTMRASEATMPKRTATQRRREQMHVMMTMMNGTRYYGVHRASKTQTAPLGFDVWSPRFDVTTT